MISYDVSIIVKAVLPYLTMIISLVTGVIIANLFWRSRVFRFAKAEVIQTLEYQKNKIDQLEHEARSKDQTISELRGRMKIINISALKIMEGLK